MADKIYSIKKTLRLTPAQNDMLSDQAEKNNQNEADYLRSLISQRPNEHPEIQKLLKKLINEINDIEEDIHRITYENEEKISVDDRDLLTALLMKVDSSIKEVVSLIGN